MSDRDVIRVVPLHVPSHVQDESSLTPPQLTYRGGRLLTAVEVFTVFYGTLWTTVKYSHLVSSINGFFGVILRSSLLDQLAEYNVPGQQIGHGRYVGSATIPAVIRRSISDAALRQELTKLVATRVLPVPTANSLYFLYIEPGVKVVAGGSGSCTSFCGYHDVMGDICYAVMPYPGCGGCTGKLTPGDALTSTSSHELCEAITDPVPGMGWYDDVNGEIGDICSWRTRKIGQYVVQLEWSNAAGKCL